MAHPPPPPPHERIWRHPAEVASATRHELRAERAGPRTRWIGTLSALVGFVVIGAGLWSVLPTTDADDSAARRDTVPPMATPIRITPERAVRLGLDADAVSRVAITPSEELTSSGDIQVRLPDGSTAAARVIGSRAGISVIELPLAPTGESYSITTVPPSSEDAEVRVLALEPYTIRFAHVNGDDSSARPAAGTAVVTLDGELLGFCVDHEDEDLVFISADELLESATETLPSDPVPAP